MVMIYDMPIDAGTRGEYAQREDGVWFMRRRRLGRYGYTWSAWKTTNSKPDDAVHAEEWAKGRLPKEIA